MGSDTTNGYFYKPSSGAVGVAELALYDAALDATDTIIAALVAGELDAMAPPSKTLTVTGTVDATVGLSINGVAVGTSTSSYWIDDGSSNISYAAGIVTVTNTSNEIALQVTTSATTIDGGVRVDADSLTTGKALYVKSASTARTGDYLLSVQQSGNSAGANTGGLANFLSSDTSTTARNLIYINNSAAAAVGTTLLKLNNASTGDSIQIDQVGNGIGIDLNNDGTNHGMHLHQDGVLASSKYGLYLYSNGNQANASALLYVVQDNAASVAGNVAFKNDGTGHALHVQQEGVSAGGKHGLYVQGTGVNVNADSALVKIIQDAATASEPALEIDNDGTAVAIEIDQSAVVSTNFKKVISLAGFTIWVSDGTTAEAALTGTAGDICLNGGTGAGQTAYNDDGSTGWTDM